MSADNNVDAGDIMSNGHSSDTAVTRTDALGEKKLQKLRTEAAEMIANGVIEMEDVTLDGHLGEGVTLAEGETDAFRESVREQLGDRIQEDATQEQEAEEGEGWDPTEVDFNAVWSEYNFPEKVSNVQLVEALAVSSHTGFKRGGAQRAIEYGIEAGTLIDIPRRLPDDSHGDEIVVTGVMYAAGDAE